MLSLEQCRKIDPAAGNVPSIKVRDLSYGVVENETIRRRMNAEFDRLGITDETTRETLMVELNRLAEFIIEAHNTK